MREPSVSGGNLGCIGLVVWLIFVLVSAHFLSVWADDFFVHVFYKTDAFGHGLRVKDWKQGILTDGREIPPTWDFLRVMIFFIPWVVLCGLTYLLIDQARFRWRAGR